MGSNAQAHVSLQAIGDNLARLRSIAAGRAILAPVKANAYGHGAVAVSRMIERTAAAEWLAVASVDEALELRRAGITLPILKLSHAFTACEVDAALSHDVTLTVVDADTIDLVSREAQRLGLEAPVHLKVDTGMRRIGTEPVHAVELARRADAAPGVRLEGLFTHLPVADVADGVDFTESELASFGKVADAITRDRGELRWVHAANSGALLTGRLQHSNLVRPGIAMYGYYPDATTPRTVELTPAMSWVTSVSFIKQIGAGETVGYGRSWAAPTDTWIATLPVGYGDGYSRLNSNRGRVLIAGRSYPIVGRVCMDQTMINLGPSEPEFGVGEPVWLLGASADERIDADELAALMGTISYEVTCLVGNRVDRVYEGSSSQ